MTVQQARDNDDKKENREQGKDIRDGKERKASGHVRSWVMRLPARVTPRLRIGFVRQVPPPLAADDLHTLKRLGRAARGGVREEGSAGLWPTTTILGCT